RIQQESARGLEIERVAVVALSRLPVVEVAVSPRAFEVVERRAERWTAAIRKPARQLVTEAGLARGSQAVDRDSEAPFAERLDHLDELVEHPSALRAGWRWYRLLPRRHGELDP